MTIQIITRAQAIERGLKKYYTGIPCKHGHIRSRTTNTCACDGCIEKYQHDLRKRIVENAWKSSPPISEVSVKVHYEDAQAIRDLAYFLNQARMNAKKQNYVKLVMDYIVALKSAMDIEEGCFS